MVVHNAAAGVPVAAFSCVGGDGCRIDLARDLGGPVDGNGRCGVQGGRSRVEWGLLTAAVRPGILSRAITRDIDRSR